MSNARGFTLVELMVVISLSILLLSWGIPAYSTWETKHDVERQISRLYNDLQFARMTAYTRKVVTGVWWGGGTSIAPGAGYEIRIDAAPYDGTIDSSDTQLGNTIDNRLGYFRQTITTSAAQASIAFNGRGFVTPDPTGVFTFSINDSSGANPNCVAVSSTRIIMGKMDAGTCKAQ